jgi:hypothetical protein
MDNFTERYSKNKLHVFQTANVKTAETVTVMNVAIEFGILNLLFR